MTNKLLNLKYNKLQNAIFSITRLTRLRLRGPAGTRGLFFSSETVVCILGIHWLTLKAAPQIT